MELVLEENDSEEERVNNHKRKKATSAQLTKLQEVILNMKFMMLISKKKGLPGALSSCYVQGPESVGPLWADSLCTLKILNFFLNCRNSKVFFHGHCNPKHSQNATWLG